jgi:DNA polymerase-1
LAVGAVKLSQEILDLQVFLCADYSGIEVRLLAIASGDPVLIEQFNNGVDIHSQVGHELTGIPIQKIRTDKETRTKVKEFHFGIIYGLGPENGPAQLKSKGVNITRKEFVQYQEKYFTRYAGVARFIQKCKDEVERTGKVTTLFGFTRRITKDDTSRGSYYLNQAVNTPIQQAAHQLLLIAYALLELKTRTYRLLQNPVMEVHDEGVWRVRLGDLLEGDKMVRHLLQEGVKGFIESHFKFKVPVPLLAEVKVGFTRGSLVEYAEPIPSIETFLTDWRAKYKKTMETPLESLMTWRKQG